MCVDDVTGAARSEKDTGSRRIRTVQGDEVGAGLPNQPGEAGLACGAPDGLSQRRGRNGNAHTALGRAREESQDAAIVPIEGDQAAGIERDAAHATLLRRVMRRAILKSAADAGRRLASGSSASAKKDA